MAVAAVPQIGRGARRRGVLVAIPLGFAVLGLILRFLAYLYAGLHPQLASFPLGLCRWDCEWYVILAKSGYDTFPASSLLDAGNWAFFPLFPMIVGGLHALTAIEVMTVATSLSIACSVGAALLAWPLLERNIRAYTLYCAFLLCGPLSIYFTTFYTEVLFVLLTNCALLALRRSNYLAAGAFAGLLSADRIVGVFFVFAIALHYLIGYRRRGGTLAGLPTELWRRPAVVLALLLAPAGLFAYMAYLHFYIGDALAFSHVQRAWGRVPGNPLTYLWAGMTHLSGLGWRPSTEQWLALATIVGLMLTGLLVAQRKYPQALFCLVCILVPLSAGTASMLRFVAALSPLVMVLMTLLAKRWPIYLVSLFACIAGDYFFTVGWLREWLPLV